MSEIKRASFVIKCKAGNAHLEFKGSSHAPGATRPLDGPQSLIEAAKFIAQALTIAGHEAALSAAVACAILNTKQNMAAATQPVVRGGE